MAAIKANALSPIDPTAKVFGADIFSQQFNEILTTQFDTNSPLLILSEGLINYFDSGLMSQLMQNLAQQLKHYSKGYYLTDLYPKPNHKLAKIIERSGRLLKFLSKSNFQYYFTTPHEAKTYFEQQGFKHVAIRQASNFDHPNETQHLGDIIWIVEAQAN